MYSNALFNQSDRFFAETPPFQEQVNIHEIKTNDHSLVRPNIHAKIEKGFFLTHNVWTCYRRNYFAVQCSYELDPHMSHRSLYLQRPDRKGQSEQIQAFAVSLSASVDGMSGKTVGLIQHTPKRDKGLEIAIPITKLWPTPPGLRHTHLTDMAHPLSAGGHEVSQHPQPMSSPHLPLQAAPDANQLLSIDTSTNSSSSSAGYASSTSMHSRRDTTHTFERLQFKQATANNGKRRAQQQYYHINVELYVDIRQKDANEPMWVMVARRSSCPVVVRGRSPIHYQSDGPSNADQGGISSQVHGSKSVPSTYNDNNMANVHRDMSYAIYPNPHSMALPPSPITYNNEAASDSGLPPSAEGQNLRIASENALLDDSSVSSIHSYDIGSRKVASLSSNTSFNPMDSVEERLARFIFEYEDVKDLAQTCFTMDDSARTERNVHRLLKDLSVYLQSEASSPAELLVARTLKQHSRKVASHMKRLAIPGSVDSTHLPLASIPVSQSYVMEQFLSDSSVTPEISTDVAIDAANSERAGSDKEGSEGGSFELHLDHLSTELEKAKGFLRKSEALEEFREGLLDFREGLRNSRHNRMLRKKETLENYREGLLDLREALRDSRHNRMLRRSENLVAQSRGPGMIRVFSVEIAGLLQKIQEAARWVVKRPVKPGFRRIEWNCDCGRRLHADFKDDDPSALEHLEKALQGLTSSSGSYDRSKPTSVPHADQGSSRTNDKSTSQASTRLVSSLLSEDVGPPRAALNLRVDQPQAEGLASSKYLATCVSTGGIYKVLTEIDVSKIHSDAEFFLAIKTVYQDAQKSRKRWRIFFKPTTVEFVQFTVWNLRQGYVSICDRPECIPPVQDVDYEFSPRPMAPLPPVPPEIFIHYLSHDHHDANGSSFVWVPRLPKRINKRIIDCNVPSYGWGLYIREGLNGVLLFWTIIVFSFCSVLLCILWTLFMGDVQGGSGLGALLLALPPIIIGAIIFRVGEMN